MMVWAPPASKLVAKVAVAELAPEAVSGWVARTFAPSEKLMEPVGGPGVVEVVVTVAVKATDWLTFAGLTDEVSEVVVASPVMICESDPELGAKLPVGV